MVVYTQEEWHAKAIELFGEDAKNWKFKCSSSVCDREQSFNTVVKQFKDGISSKRLRINGKAPNGIPENPEDKELNLAPYAECYGPECDWTSYGLFHSGVLVIYDSTKPHDSQSMENCIWVFPFAEPRKCRLCGYNLDKNEPDNKTDLCTQCQLGEDMSEEWEMPDGSASGWGSPPPGARRKQ